MLIGCVYPVFGGLMIKCIFGLLTANPPSEASNEISSYVMWLAILAGSLGITAIFRAIFFGYIGENITMNMRKDLYTSILRKHMGWHDDRRHNSGIMTSLLSGECSHLQGLGTEAVGVIIECMFSLGFAIAIAFYFSWPMALIALGLTPLMVISTTLSA